MHQERPCTVRWGKPNLMGSVEEKMLKAIQKDGITKWAQN
jgi:hypothetical protein